MFRDRVSKTGPIERHRAAGAPRSTWDDSSTLVRRPYFVVKRLIDLVSAFALLMILSPVVFAIAVLVLVFDGRPILYRQTRFGRGGAPFTIRKFRTMRRDAEEHGPLYARRRDDRCTSLGRVLRPTGLDELPQLWSVLRGEMSLIGPRPERPEFARELMSASPQYRARLFVRPGIVGWAEVNVVHAENLEAHLERLTYDLSYLERANLLLDMRIALRTLVLLVNGSRW